ncbi:MAG: hypothetical protein LBU04_02745 [Christensenellaceae bacterium]|jgi:hypothetical protein|nr:hypothetical protein [Christensenellaceae bacterium]
MTVEDIKPVNVLVLDFSMPELYVDRNRQPHTHDFIGDRKRNAQNCASYPAKEKRQE